MKLKNQIFVDGGLRHDYMYRRKDTNMKELTLKDLHELPPHSVIATGLTIDNYTGVNMSGSDNVLRWVAVRGEIHDWAIYIGFSVQSVDEISRHGDKVYDKGSIKKLVPCDDEAFAKYRH